VLVAVLIIPCDRSSEWNGAYNNAGWGAAQATIRNGARWGTYNAFLKRTLSRESVHILTRAVVQKVGVVRIFILHCVSEKQTSPFLCVWYFCQISSDSANYWQRHTTGNLKQTHVHAQFISRFVFVLYLVKLATDRNAHLDVGRFPFVLSLKKISQLL